jgi:hypothetical protein
MQQSLSAYSRQASAGTSFARPASGRSRNTDALSARLNDYFNAVDLQDELTGYSTQNVLSVHHCRGLSGHKVLIREMSSRNRQTGAAIHKLDERYQAVVIAKYGIFRDDKGATLTDREKAEIILVTYNQFLSRLKIARKYLRAALF